MAASPFKYRLGNKALNPHRRSNRREKPNASITAIAHTASHNKKIRYMKPPGELKAKIDTARKIST